jgi:hypothetical protein
MANNKSWLGLLVIVIVALNLSWEHQTILIPMVTLTDYYHFAAREPFVYRMLPALVYHLVVGRHGDWLTGMNAPFDSSYSIFQLLLDTVSLVVTLIFMQKIARELSPRLKPAITLAFAAAATLVIVVFGYYMVPNRALFYPYDFPDTCLATIIFYLCIRLRGRAEHLLPVMIFIATLNKETAIFYSGLYVALRAPYKTTDWRLTTTVLAECSLAFLMARGLVVSLVQLLGAHAPTTTHQYEFHLMYTLEQLKNPLFIFAMLNICSYLYVPVFLLRKKLDRTDLLILFMIGGWIAIMSAVGIVRELRIFVPASLMMYVVLARHLAAVAEAWVPGVVMKTAETPRVTALAEPGGAVPAARPV